MLDLRLVKTFLAVAAGCSFRGAAHILNLAPSTVTAQIKDLENELGATLFDRLGRTVLLTEQGERLLAYARRLADMEAETRRAMDPNSQDQGHLSVRISESLGVLCLAPVLAAFRKRFPDTRLTIDAVSRQSLQRDLGHGLTDIALLLSEPFDGPALDVQTLARERLNIIAPPGSPLTNQGRVGPQDLAGIPLFLTRYVWSARGVIEQALSHARVSPAAVVECSSLEMVKRCVMAGLGVSVAPRFSVSREAAQGLLATLDWTGGSLEASVLLVRRQDRWLSKAAEAFMDSVRNFFANTQRQY